jgi:hypothetical protein
MGGPSPVVTPRTQAVNDFFPSYNNVYVRRRRADQQEARPERRYPERNRRAPDVFTFN